MSSTTGQTTHKLHKQSQEHGTWIGHHCGRSGLRTNKMDPALLNTQTSVYTLKAIDKTTEPLW